MARQSSQLVSFGRREEAPRDLRVIGLRPEVFEINADVRVSGDGDEGKTGRVSKIESEPAAEFRAEVGLAECVVHIAYSARWRVQIAPQELTQYSVHDNETLPVALESKTCAAVTFVKRERPVETSRCFRRNVQTGAPTMHFVGRQLKQAR